MENSPLVLSESGNVTVKVLIGVRRREILQYPRERQSTKLPSLAAQRYSKCSLEINIRAKSMLSLVQSTNINVYTFLLYAIGLNSFI